MQIKYSVNEILTIEERDKRITNASRTSSCSLFQEVSPLSRSSRKRDRFTVRPSDYISDSVTAPSSTATASV